LLFTDITVQPESVKVAVGQQVTLICNALGVDNLMYSWTIEGQQMVAPEVYSNILNISNASLSDTGEYICVVINGNSSVNSIPVKVTVLGKPSF